MTRDEVKAHFSSLGWEEFELTEDQDGLTLAITALWPNPCWTLVPGEDHKVVIHRGQPEEGCEVALEEVAAVIRHGYLREVASKVREMLNVVKAEVSDLYLVLAESPGR